MSGAKRPQGSTVGPVALALSQSAIEAELVTALASRVGQSAAVRRCVDCVDLLSVVGAGIVRGAVLDADFAHIDADVVARLVASGVVVVGICYDEVGDRRLRQWGVTQVVDISASDIDNSADRIAIALSNLTTSSAPQNGNKPASFNMDRPIVDDPKTGKLVAVWGSHGAPGRTSVAMGLAEGAGRLGHSALLIDADTYAPSVAPMLGIADDASGLIAACRHASQGTLDTQTLARLARSIDNNWRVLTGLPTADRWPEVRAGSIDIVWRVARALSELTIVDIGASLTRDEELLNDLLVPRRDAAALTAVANADVVVATSGCQPVALTRMLSGVRELRAVNSTAPLIVVINRVRDTALGSDGKKGLRDFVSQQSRADRVHFIPFDAAAFDSAALRCRTVTEHAPNSKAVAAMTGLVDAVLTAATQCRNDTEERAIGREVASTSAA